MNASVLPRAARALSRTTGGAPTGTVARRGMAGAAEEEVAWSEYRSGKKTLQEWVDANRHVVAGGFFCFYVGIAAWNLRPKKKKPAPADDAAPAK